MRCPACGGETPDGRRFCGDCGRPLAALCPACGAELLAGKSFCVDCGTPLGAGTPSVSSPAVAEAARPLSALTTELRHVSVLFCDLVGFTPFSEKRDPEEVREVLSGYFELARAIVGRYGGVIEKFIGDAVMAVWGAPVANEDDAERAVRAGLDLISAVAAYGSAHGFDLKARVGIVTGAVVTVERAEEGLVTGDRVNTAARVQSAAPPGCCYVDETTRSASAAAVAYVDVGEHELKGKAEPVRLFEATRVVGAVAGLQQAGVLEAPFVGRDHELRLVKELFHASSDSHLARMVLVSGVAGVGKSRLSWEFFKYIDGLAGTVLWHNGRCLSYGEGVSYWALSEMVRARLQINEEDTPEVVTERLRSGLERWIADGTDREFIFPRLGQLLGLSSATVLAKEELFAGWRLFFERLSEHLPVVMVVEDLQWADAGMVGFLDHLLEWSGDHSLFILVLSRPDGTDRMGAVLSRRSITTLPLDPLSDEVVGDLLEGLVIGLPRAARERIVERSEGIPLYAIETVRGLLDKGILEKGDEGALRLIGDLGELEVPPGLTALIASRLDALEPDERRLVKECSVFGGSFPRQSIAAISDIDSSEIEVLLSALVRKEVLTVRADKLSPERGQYDFTQSLIRSVAYDTLTRRERKTRHLRTAEHLRSAFPDDGAEVAEVIAAHLYDAYLAARDAPESDELRVGARDAFAKAAKRAESVGALEAAEAALVRAAELSPDEAEQAGYIFLAGQMASDAGWYERAVGHYETAAAANAGAGRIIEAALITARLGPALHLLGRIEQAITHIREALGSLEGIAAPPEVVAALKTSLAACLIPSGRGDEAALVNEEALTLAQHYELPELLYQGLISRANRLSYAGRAEEARLNYEGAISLARRHGITRGELLAEANLADDCMIYDLPGAEDHARAALAAARRRGRRDGEAWAGVLLMYILTMAGRFEEARQLGTELLQAGGDERPGADKISGQLAHLEALCGNTDAARAHLSGCRAWVSSDDIQKRSTYLSTEAMVLLSEGDSRHALESARRAIDEAMSGGIGLANEVIRLAFPVAVEAAIDLSELEEADQLAELVAVRPPGEVPPYLRAQVTRSKALAAAARGEDELVAEKLASVEAIFRDLGYGYWRARTQLDLAEWFAGRQRLEESATLATEAAATFAAVGAAPMLVRARSLSEPETARNLSVLDDRLLAQSHPLRSR